MAVKEVAMADLTNPDWASMRLVVRCAGKRWCRKRLAVPCPDAVLRGPLGWGEMGDQFADQGYYMSTGVGFPGGEPVFSLVCGECAKKIASTQQREHREAVEAGEIDEDEEDYH